MSLPSPGSLLVAHAALTWALTGVIWFVQVVHYPLFAAVDQAAFPAYHRAHMQQTTWVVAPLMLAEAAVAVWLVAVRAAPAWAVWTNLGLLAVVWAATFGLSVPRHDALAAGGFDAAVVRELVSTNWVRTVAWTMRAVLAAGLL